MARVRNGIFGQYSGKIGNMVYYQVNDKTFVRRKGEITGPPSEEQKSCRSEMSLATHLSSSLLTFLKVGWLAESTTKKRSAFHLSLSYNKKHAMKTVNGVVELDYSKVLVAKGSLPPAQLATVMLDAGGLLFSWFVDQEQPQQSDWDQVILLAYYPESDNKVFTLAGVARSAGSMVLEIPEQMRQGEVETYIAFVNTDRTACSDSVYTGRLALRP